MVESKRMSIDIPVPLSGALSQLDAAVAALVRDLVDTLLVMLGVD